MTVTLKVPFTAGVNDFVPDVAVEPIPGEPLHRVAFVDDQLSVALSPSVTEVGPNDAVTVGAGAGAETDTDAVALPLPPSPVQVTVTLKLPVAVGVNDFVPDVAVEPIPGEPLHPVAFVDDQLSVALSPSVIEVGSKEAVTVGAGVGAGVASATDTDAVSSSLPPAPVQVTVTLKLPVAVGVNDFVPDVAVEPIPGEPLHPVASVDDQLSVALSPSVIEVGSKEAVTVGAGGGVGAGVASATDTDAVSSSLPPAPVQVTVTLKLPVAVGVNDFVPDVSVEPIPGEPLHSVAFVDDQLSVALSPSVIEVGSKEAVTVGAGVVTDTDAVASPLPPAPVHVTVTLKLPVAVGVNDFVPDVSVEPIPGEPLHSVAFVDDQVNVALWPRVIELLSKDALTVGGRGTVTTTASKPDEVQIVFGGSGGGSSTVVQTFTVYVYEPGALPEKALESANPW